MKSLVELLALLVLDCARKVGAQCHRDVETLRWRVEHEGDSFITITLPAFCKDFERSLDRGWIAPGDFVSFGKTDTGIPEFLQGFLRNVFDRSGHLLTEPSTDCIRLVRQVCLFGKKVRRPCSPERVSAAADAYVECDQSLEDPGGELWQTFRQVASVICESLQSIETLVSVNIDEVLPHHGPGATAEHILGNQKWSFRRWHKRLERVGFRYLRFGRAQSYLGEIGTSGTVRVQGVWPEMVEPEDEQPVRVVFVPKTQVTPRVIAVEPVCMQYAQQALKDKLVRLLERNRYTGGHINFRDQTVNQALALDASKTGYFATLDMSEASDRVSLAHVTGMLENLPAFRQWVLACRSTRAELPDGRVIDLKKFASMGSALCFPVEALVFYMSIIASRILRADVAVDSRSVRFYGRDTFVYGDDLIVPADEASAICDDLDSLGFKVNRRKSFWTGKFRESCGVDAYDGVNVTPTYLRVDVPADRADVSGLLSTMSTTEQLYSAGLWETAGALRKCVEEVFGELPEVPVNSPAVGWHHHSEVALPKRWNDDIQQWEYHCWVVSPPSIEDPIEGDPALAKCFRTIGKTDILDVIRGVSPTVNPDHLEESVRPYCLNLKRRWVPFT